MTNVISPTPKQRFVDNNGNALSGGKLFTYLGGTAGTTKTKTPTYTDSAGVGTNTNPIILNSRGECDLWLDPAIASYDFVLSPSTDTDPPTNAIWTVALVVPPNAATITIATTAQTLAGTSLTLASAPAGVAKAIQQGFTYGAVTGTANAITVSPTITPNAFADGMRAQFTAALTNTGPTTLNYGGLGTVDIKKWDVSGTPQQLGGGEIVAGNLVEVVRVAAASAWILLDPNGVSQWPTGTINGLTLSRATATTYGIATGKATSEQSGTQFDMTLGSAFTKSLSAFAAGTGNGSLDTGGIAATTWYHVHLIRKDSDGSIDVLLSLSASAPTMPSGYTGRRRIGSILTNGSSQIVAFSQNGDEFLWDAAVIDADATNPGTGAVTRTLTVPTGVKVLAQVSVGGYTGTNSFTITVSSLDVSDQAPQTFATAALSGFPSNTAQSGAGNGWNFSTQNVRTNTSAQIRTRLSASGAADHIGLVTRGWFDTRGR